MATIKFQHINKIYDNKVQAVFDFNLEVQDKEFIVFVGPSGCGKSTTLRMLAGLEDISSGELYIDDVLVNDVQPKDRNIAMVFQSYALYPHMTVYNNMAFALKLKKTPKEEIDRRIHEAAEILGLEPYLQRKPKALSGGQRQRVALGRAIVRSPKVFLMDEPLSNLDAKLRVQMRAEIARIHENVGATTVYVTHDQTEAMTMATRIVVIKDGRIQQIGTPKEVYNHPVNMFVGGFIGSPAMNFFNGEFADGKFWFGEKDGGVSFTLNKEQCEHLKDREGTKIVLGVRPEDINVVESGKNCVQIACDVVELLGYELILHGDLGGQRAVFRASAKKEVRPHDTVTVSFNEENLHFFDPETTNVI